MLLGAMACLAAWSQPPLYLSKGEDGTVFLRWSPKQWPADFAGYVLIRAELDQDGHIKADTVTIIADDIRPDFSDEFLGENGLTDVITSKPTFKIQNPQSQSIIDRYAANPNDLSDAYLMARRSQQWARALGLGFTDTTARRDRTYRYELQMRRSEQAAKRVSVGLCFAGSSVFGDVTVEDIEVNADWEDDRVDLSWTMNKPDLADHPHRQVNGFSFVLNGERYQYRLTPNGLFTAQNNDTRQRFTARFADISRYLQDGVLQVSMLPTDYYGRIGEPATTFRISKTTARKQAGASGILKRLRRTSMTTMGIDVWSQPPGSIRANQLTLLRLDPGATEFRVVTPTVRKGPLGYVLTDTLPEVMVREGGQLAYSVRWGDEDQQVSPSEHYTVAARETLLPPITDITSSGQDGEQLMTIHWKPADLLKGLRAIRVYVRNETTQQYFPAAMFEQDLESGKRSINAAALVTDPPGQETLQLRFDALYAFGQGPLLEWPQPFHLKRSAQTIAPSGFVGSFENDHLQFRWTFEDRRHDGIRGFQVMAGDDIYLDTDVLMPNLRQIESQKKIVGEQTFGIRAVYPNKVSKTVWLTDPIVIDNPDWRQPEAAPQARLSWKRQGTEKQFSLYQVEVADGVELISGLMFRVQQGRLRSIEHYRNNQRHGISRTFNPDGDLWLLRIYQNGSPTQYEDIPADVREQAAFRLSDREQDMINSSQRPNDLDPPIALKDLQFLELGPVIGE